MSKTNNEKDTPEKIVELLRKLPESEQEKIMAIVKWEESKIKHTNKAS